MALTRVGTRVIEDFASSPASNTPLDLTLRARPHRAPFLNLTPGTRSGIIQDERYAALIDALAPLETHVKV